MNYSPAQIRVINQTHIVFQAAKEIFPQLKIDFPQIIFKVTGRVAGRVWEGKSIIDYNTHHIYQFEEDCLKNTVPHEVAHLITFILYPGVKAHGEEWKYVMGCLIKKLEEVKA